MSGWFAVKRGITAHPIFKGQPERLAIWLWLLDNAAWTETKHDVNGVTVTVPRGSVSASERRIAEEVGVGRQVVRTFLARLEADTMLTRSPTHGRNMLTLCNWDKYQIPESRDNPNKNPKLTQDQPIKETREQDIPLEPNGSNGVEPVEISLLSTLVWDIGIRLLGRHGTPEAKARPLIGKWRRDAENDSALLAAYEAAHKAGTRDPISYITKVLQPKPPTRNASEIMAQLEREGRA